jgi:hypothetical protein
VANGYGPKPIRTDELWMVVENQPTLAFAWYDMLRTKSEHYKAARAGASDSAL